MNFTLDTHSHSGGVEAIPQSLVVEVVQAVESLTLADRELTPPLLRSGILSALYRRGWPSRVRVDPISQVTIPSLKDSIGLCAQMGNMSRLYADLLKLQYCYLRRGMRGAIFLVMKRRTAVRLGKNLAQYERLVSELDLFREIVTLPLLVLGVEAKK